MELKSEDEVQQEIRLEAPKYGISLWRNNSGAMKDENGRVVRYGLANDSKKLNDNFKSSDLIGITPITVTQSMVGKTVGIFTAIEIKKQGWNGKLDARAKAQKNFIDFVLAKGGLASFAQSVDEFRNIFVK